MLEERPELRFPADMYMEGGDQFRGWFQSSLLTSVASKGCAPYKSVLGHGWVVDEQGKQMHKSAGNGVEPSEIIKDYGADIIQMCIRDRYSNASQASLRLQLNQLNDQIDLLQKSQNTSALQLDTLLKERSSALYDLLDVYKRQRVC